jgi:hypothetical protein
MNEHQDNRNDTSDGLTNFKNIIEHQGPLNHKDAGYKGIQAEWEDGCITYIPLSVIAVDDPVSCAVYSKRNNLLSVPGLKQFKWLTSYHQSKI